MFRGVGEFGIRRGASLGDLAGADGLQAPAPSFGVAVEGGGAPVGQVGGADGADLRRAGGE